MAVFALLLAPATIAACAAGSEFGLTGTTTDILADAGSGERTEPDDGGAPSSSGGTGSGGGSGSNGSGGGSRSAASSSDAALGSASGHDAASDDASGSDAASSPPHATDATAPNGDDADDGATMNCPVSVRKNTYDTTYDGYITYLNTGTGSETNPTVQFTVPSGATIDTSVCTGSSGLTNQIVPSGIVALSCSQSGTTISYTFTGTMPADAQIAL